MEKIEQMAVDIKFGPKGPDTYLISEARCALEVAPGAIEGRVNQSKEGGKMEGDQGKLKTAPFKSEVDDQR